MAHPEVKVLQVIDELAPLLTQCGLEFWSDKLTGLRHLLESNPDEGRLRVLSLYGGMGSFTDTLIGEEHGAQMERRIRDLQERLFKLCHGMS